MRLGVIGYGNRIRHMINEVIRQDPSCALTAIVDVRQDALRQELRDQNDGIQYFSTPEDMLDSGAVDGVFIGTRCSLHTPMALKVLPTGLPLYLEKPVATNMEDLYRLKAAYEASQSGVVVSFPLRLTTIVQLVQEIVASGKIGTIEHVQAVNNVPYGNVYYQSWYRDEQETGGLFLQKATHDFDYLNAILGQKPTDICAMVSKQIFKGTKPAGLTCSACEENQTCPESSLLRKDYTKHEWTQCCFAEDTGNEDSGSALIRYESGMHVSYSQNFFARRGAGARGARFMGYKGTIEFDFYTGIVKVHMHHTPRVETYELTAGDDHFGGDPLLAKNFIDIMQNGSPSLSSLDDGLTSALMCLAAKKSAETGTFQPVSWTAQASKAASV
ncbi:Gfo/Idh/MocA family protein [Paenibacillus spongiae]|uniref:Gfo/Idh/MocA family oxidoreductase n=1 Tax=Paenibacillus spongiae TaxID=2909671 RepID=A0ABY5SA02_9BACL|nr:Gfo/Idh/MocA family oxidoreductase [Paenibacillus spongiae]UVI30757.1 Gfo/Idh/MocA family oxidoreductase [Paenibacillus spongiae]